MPDGLCVRQRVPTDLHDLAKVLISVSSAVGYPVEGIATSAEAEAFINPAAIICAWVATLDDVIVGHVLVTKSLPGNTAAQAYTEQQKQQTTGLHRTAEVVSLGRFFVSPDAYRRGIGRLLLETATAWGEDQGEKLVLDVTTQRQDAIALYEKLGWRKIGEGIYKTHKGEQFQTWLFSSPSSV